MPPEHLGAGLRVHVRQYFTMSLHIHVYLSHVQHCKLINPEEVLSVEFSFVTRVLRNQSFTRGVPRLEARRASWKESEFQVVSLQELSVNFHAQSSKIFKFK